MKMVLALIVIACGIGYSLASCDDAHAQQKKLGQMPAGQGPACWVIPDAPSETFQCSDGSWQVTFNGSILTGHGPLPAEFQAIPEAQGPPTMSQFAPSFLFGSGVLPNAPRP